MQIKASYVIKVGVKTINKLGQTVYLSRAALSRASLRSASISIAQGPENLSLQFNEAFQTVLIGNVHFLSHYL